VVLKVENKTVDPAIGAYHRCAMVKVSSNKSGVTQILERKFIFLPRRLEDAITNLGAPLLFIVYRQPVACVVLATRIVGSG
jgi:hypothetical protein